MSLSNEKYKYAIVAGLIAFILLMPRSSIMSGVDYTAEGANNIYGERGIWKDIRGDIYGFTGLWRAIKGEEMRQWPSLNRAKTIRNNQVPFIELESAIGIFGYYAGPLLYILDPVCLPDPFRSRLNIVLCDMIFWEAYKTLYNEDPPIKWRVGHYYRPIPSGYALSILRQQNLIDDPNLNKYYSVVRNIVQDDIFSVERFINIFKMNFGFYNVLIKHYKYQSYDEEIYYNDLVRFDPFYYSYQGDYYHREKRYYEAIEDYWKYIEGVGRHDGLAWASVAVCLFHVEDYKNASVCWKTAKSLEANFNSTIAKEFEEALNSALQKQNN
jgi:tetratricopeptide (TPR) repeat protein